MRTGRTRTAGAVVLLVTCQVACSSKTGSPTASQGMATGPVPQTFQLNVTAVDTTFVTRDHFMAAVEMQISGEPFAQAMGRDLGGYSRDYTCQACACDPNSYFDPALNGGMAGGPNGRLDLPGFSTAVESYEYSKQPMNNIAFESGAGTSLLFGPVLNPSGATGAAALQGGRAWVQKLAGESNAVSRFVHAEVTATNPMGWPGFWPTMHPFAQWDPSIQPSNASTGCSISSDDDPGASGSLSCDDYECDYTTLHLPNRSTQVTATIDPGSSGWAGWKEALWTLNYLQVMHDSQENPVNTVPDDQLALVGTSGNTILGNGGVGATTLPGTFLGSSDIEGFQAGNFLQMLDNQADHWLLSLTTTDGATLGGFPTLMAALQYNAASPLQWFPGSIAVTEADDDSGFPRPTAYSIASPDSHLLDLAGLLGAFSSIYSLTDQSNAQVGGSQPALVYFDGDPFPVQNQIPDGEPTLHDRALAMMRVLVVNIDRLHFVPASNVFVDDVGLANASPMPGTTLSSDVAAYALLALRTARRALDSELTLYSNTKPDAEGVPSLLDAFPMSTATPFGTRLDQLIALLSDVFFVELTTADGHAYSGWNLATGSPTDDGASLDAYSATIRGLLVAYLATGQTRYRDRAQAVFNRLDGTFYDPSSRTYWTTAGSRPSTITFTARRFGLLQGALRDTYELVASLPGNEAMAALVEDRVGRLNKLVLNGWDDRNQDQNIEWPYECANTKPSPDGGPPIPLGGLQMAERVLSGESGSVADLFDAGTRVVSTDREHDCVPEISAVGLPAALANSVTFTLTPWSSEGVCQ
ncbi:MAG TPA: hypothetical protein VK841_09910 [Polyangiaceae bacterium]|nr:hypothetical protein [Polyangiaceae bacterium]